MSCRRPSPACAPSHQTHAYPITATVSHNAVVGIAAGVDTGIALLNGFGYQLAESVVAIHGRDRALAHAERVLAALHIAVGNPEVRRAVGEGAVLFYTGAISSIERTNTPFVSEYD